VPGTGGGNSGGSNTGDKVGQARDREFFPHCHAVPPAPNVDWTRNTYHARIPVASRFTTMWRDPVENRVEYALWAIPQLLAGGRTAFQIAEMWGVSIYLVRTLIDAAHRDDFSLQGIAWMALGLVLPGTFALEEARKRLTDATLTYTAVVTYTFVFSCGQRRSQSESLRKGGRTITGRRMIGLRPSITSQLNQLALDRDNHLARHVWYREILD